MNRNRLIAAAALLLGLAGCGGNDEPTPAVATPPPADPSAMTFPSDEEFVPVERGLYRVPRNGAVTGYDVTVPAGWGVEHGEILTKNPGTSRAISVEVWALSEITVFDDACHGEGVKGQPPSATGELISALRAQKSGPRTSEPVSTSFAGLPASRFDLTPPAGESLADCRIAGALQVWDGYLVLFAHEPATVYVVGNGSNQQVFVTRIGDGTTAADRQELRLLLDSVSLEQSS